MRLDIHPYAAKDRLPGQRQFLRADHAARVVLDLEAFLELEVRNAPQELADADPHFQPCEMRSEEHTSELQSLMRISYAVFCLKKKTKERETQSYEADD